MLAAVVSPVNISEVFAAGKSPTVTAEVLVPKLNELYPLAVAMFGWVAQTVPLYNSVPVI
jgi:hypothetical protein